ncbi:MAG: hypothetical protein ABL951_14860 [Alphaproteobacteria bacterium]
MNFIKDRELALRFKNNAVPSQERLLYLLIFSVIGVTFMSSVYAAYTHSTKPGTWDIYADIAMLVMTVLGILVCYRTNKAGDDKEFIERYTSIGFPVTVRTLFILVPASVLCFVILALVMGGEISDQNPVFNFLFVMAYSFYYFWRLNSSIRIAAN